jgi:hypothetical protein
MYTFNIKRRLLRDIFRVSHIDSLQLPLSGGI